MTPDTSRALARFIAEYGLGREAARDLAEQYGSTEAVDLPEWMLPEVMDPPRTTSR